MASRQNWPVLIVEDDPSMNHALERILRIAGYDPIAFESGEALIGDGRSAGAVCIVADVQLPGMSGFELHRRLLQEGRPAPFIFITAYDEPETRLKAQEAGAVAYLTKPFAGHDLIEAVMQAHGATPPSRGRRWRSGR